MNLNESEINIKIFNCIKKIKNKCKSFIKKAIKTLKKILSLFVDFFVKAIAVISGVSTSFFGSTISNMLVLLLCLIIYVEMPIVTYILCGYLIINIIDVVVIFN